MWTIRTPVGEACHNKSMKKYLSRAAILGMVCAPVFTSALTQSELMDQINTLLAQISSLQGELPSGASGSRVTLPAIDTTGECPVFTRTLKRGMSGKDVKVLQAFLAEDLTIYPEASVSGYFGGLTEAAVQRWQAQYTTVTEGSPETTGFGIVGPRTAALMAQQCTGGISASKVGGFIKITPISGNAPLGVRVEATINTPRSCGSALYTLSWGDGSAPVSIPLPGKTCRELMQNFTHTYQFGGTYTVTLASEGHTTSGTVVVQGPSSGNFNLNANSAAATTLDSLQTSATSGSSPLSVTFSGTINGSVSCGGGFYTIVFGDGQSQQMQYPASCNAQTFSTAHVYQNAGTYNAVLYRGGPGSTVAGTAQILVSQGSASTNTGTGSASTNSTTNAVVSPDLGVTPNVGGNRLAVQVQFTVPSVCTAFDVDWGDGSAHTGRPQGSCSAGVVQETVVHTYATGGVRTITVKRGPLLDQVSVTTISL